MAPAIFGGRTFAATSIERAVGPLVRLVPAQRTAVLSGSMPTVRSCQRMVTILSAIPCTSCPSRQRLRGRRRTVVERCGRGWQAA